MLKTIEECIVLNIVFPFFGSAVANVLFIFLEIESAWYPVIIGINVTCIMFLAKGMYGFSKISEKLSQSTKAQVDHYLPELQVYDSYPENPMYRWQYSQLIKVLAKKLKDS